MRNAAAVARGMRAWRVASGDYDAQPLTVDETSDIQHYVWWSLRRAPPTVIETRRRVGDGTAETCAPCAQLADFLAAFWSLSAADDGGDGYDASIVHQVVDYALYHVQQLLSARYDDVVPASLRRVVAMMAVSAHPSQRAVDVHPADVHAIGAWLVRCAHSDALTAPSANDVCTMVYHARAAVRAMYQHDDTARGARIDLALRRYAPLARHYRHAPVCL